MGLEALVIEEAIAFIPARKAVPMQTGEVIFYQNYQGLEIFLFVDFLHPPIDTELGNVLCQQALSDLDPTPAIYVEFSSTI